MAAIGSKKSKKSTMATIIGHEVVALDSVSLGTDSGWRDLDSERVDELVAMIVEGSWGATSLAGPSLIAASGTKLTSCEDGKYIIFNGKHVVKALMVARERAAGATAAESEAGSAANAGTAGATAAVGEGAAAWVTDALTQIFEVGLLFTIYEFQAGAYTSLRHQTVQALSHEEEQNKLYHTTLAQKAQLVRQYYVAERMDWAKAQAALTAELGQAKARTVTRWVVLARDFSEEVMKHLAVLGLKSLGQGYVVNNKYLTGKAADARYRLTDEWAKVAFAWLRASREAGVHVTAESFAVDFCAAAKHAESWVKAQVATFGVVATGFRAFSRAVDKLQSESGRRNVLSWMSSADRRQQKHFGLEELATLVEEMQKTKAGTNKSAAGASADSAVSAGAAGDTEAGATVSGAEAAVAAEDADMTALIGDDEPPLDPVLQKAESMATSEMASISIHTDAATFADELKSTIYASSRPLIVVECPTSRQTTFFSLLERVSDVPGGVASGLLIPLGSRDELISTLRGALRKRFPGRRVDLVTLSIGKQTTRIRPSYVIYMPPTADVQAPAHVSIEGCRARASEGIRLRCTMAKCPFRPTSTTHPDEQLDENAEINPEDIDEPNFEACFDPTEVDADDDAYDAAGTSAAGGPAGSLSTDCKQNLFPYAAPQALHHRMLMDIGQAHTRTHLVIATRTAHPGLVLAARQAGLKVIAYLDGVRPHSAAHGNHLLKAQLTASKMSAARDATPTARGQKRYSAADIQYQVVQAPSAQPILLRDITPSAANWRSGLNTSPVDLDVKALRQVQSELDATSGTVTLECRNGQEIAMAGRSFREGDVVCTVGGLLFDSMERLTAFFHTNDCGKEFLGNVVKIEGIHEEDTTAQASAGSAALMRATSMYFVITGIGRFFRHYATSGKQVPNVALSVNVAAGAGDGLLQVIVRTRNRCGVALGSQLVLNYGMEYDHQAVAKSEAAASQSPKRLRGLLDSFFAKLGPHDGPQAAAAVGESSAAAAAGAAALALADAAAKLTDPSAAGATATQAVQPAPADPAAVPQTGSGASAAVLQTGSGASAAVLQTGSAGSAAVPESGGQHSAPAATLTLASGEEVINEIKAPLHLAVVFGKQIRLAAMTPLEGNKKLPPRTLLATTSNGTIGATAGATAVKFAFDKTKTTYVVQSGTGAVMTLYDLIEKTGAKSVSKHGAWVGGVPASLQSQSAAAFQPAARSAFWDAVQSSGCLAVAWVLKLTDKKVLTPTGIAVYNPKQVIIPASGTIVLS
jgi:hypothetical protein